jgi:hypothetical protein
VKYGNVRRTSIQKASKEESNTERKINKRIKKKERVNSWGVKEDGGENGTKYIE